MRLVAIDTNIAVWGVRKTATPGQEYRLADAKIFIDRLTKERAVVALPMTVVGEYLAALPVHTHAASMAVLQKRFRLYPYDARCAMQAAQIWRQKKLESGEIEAVKISHPGVTSNKIKTDLQIIATCVANGVDTLYSEDGPLKKLAEGWVKTGGIFLPGQGGQVDLF